MNSCRHLLCELIGSACSIATNRSRGCRPNLGSRVMPPDVIDEVRTLLAAIERDPDRAACVRLAEIVRREALNDRPVLAHARIEEPELVPGLERLCVRRGVTTGR